MSKYATPHPAITTRYQPSTEWQIEDDTVYLEKDGEEVGHIQIGTDHPYFIAWIAVGKDSYRMGAERRSYKAAAGDARAMLIKEGVVA